MAYPGQVMFAGPDGLPQTEPMYLRRWFVDRIWEPAEWLNTRRFEGSIRPRGSVTRKGSTLLQVCAAHGEFDTVS
jgi:hypothetical protein